MPKDEMKKNEGEEIVNVAATITITEAVKAYKEKKSLDKVSVAEKYKDYDFIGNAGKNIKKLIISGIGKAKTFLGKSKEFINNDIYQTIVRAAERHERNVERVEKVKEVINDAKEFIKDDFEKTVEREKARHQNRKEFIETVKEEIESAPKKIDDAILEKQMAHAREVFEKRKNRQTFTSKVEDLKNVIMFKIKSWRDNKKEDFANMLEETKAYARLTKDKVIEGYEHIGMQTAIGVSAVKKVGRTVKEGFETGIEKAKDIKEDVKLSAVDMAGKAKEGVVNAAVAVSGAVVAAPGKTKQAVKKSAKKVAFKGTKGLREVLNKAAVAAKNSVDKLDEKLNEQEKEMQNDNKNKDDEAR